MEHNLKIKHLFMFMIAIFNLEVKKKRRLKATRLGDGAEQGIA